MEKNSKPDNIRQSGQHQTNMNGNETPSLSTPKEARQHPRDPAFKDPMNAIASKNKYLLGYQSPPTTPKSFTTTYNRAAKRTWKSPNTTTTVVQSPDLEIPHLRFHRPTLRVWRNYMQNSNKGHKNHQLLPHHTSTIIEGEKVIGNKQLSYIKVWIYIYSKNTSRLTQLVRVSKRKESYRRIQGALHKYPRFNHQQEPIPAPLMIHQLKQNLLKRIRNALERTSSDHHEEPHLLSRTRSSTNFLLAISYPCSPGKSLTSIVTATTTKSRHILSTVFSSKQIYFYNLTINVRNQSLFSSFFYQTTMEASGC